MIELSEVCNFADDNTIFSCRNSFEDVTLLGMKVESKLTLTKMYLTFAKK